MYGRGCGMCSGPIGKWGWSRYGSGALGKLCQLPNTSHEPLQVTWNTQEQLLVLNIIMHIHTTHCVSWTKVLNYGQMLVVNTYSTHTTLYTTVSGYMPY